MNNELYNKLFSDAQGMLSGAIDLLRTYAEETDNKTDGTKMYNVLNIIEEVERKLNFYEAAASGEKLELTINNII
ncbi:MAG: hypothetical protein Q4G63_10040 [Bacteroidia bacterium]|nr:hypothetical protein [Bacteroidia bacterium]